MRLSYRQLQARDVAAVHLPASSFTSLRLFLLSCTHAVKEDARRSPCLQRHLGLVRLKGTFCRYRDLQLRHMQIIFPFHSPSCGTIKRPSASSATQPRALSNTFRHFHSSQLKLHLHHIQHVDQSAPRRPVPRSPRLECPSHPHNLCGWLEILHQ